MASFFSKKKDHSKRPAIGIDLGTTYCCVAVWNNGKVEVIANDQGNRITPSKVAYTKKERLVGESAEIEQTLEPHNVIHNSKRFIGRKFSDPLIENNKDNYSFKFTEGRQNQLLFEIDFKGKKKHIAPEEVGATLLSKMKKTAEAYLGKVVKDAVITVPAYFNDAQRKATISAGKIAGLNVMRIINEPTAAAIAYNLQKLAEKDEDQHIMVYDLGGGTMDVSILNLDESGTIEVLATSGNTFLGGEDFNQKLFQHFKVEIERRYKYNIYCNPKAKQRVLKACEQIKRDLSATNGQNASVEISNLLPDNLDVTLSISRAKFEYLCKDHFQSTFDLGKNYGFDFVSLCGLEF